jgi:hypothetical protein
MIDECKNYCWSYFLNKKITLKEKVSILILELKDQTIKIKILRCEEAVEKSFGR